MEPTRKPSRSKWRPFGIFVLVLVGLYVAFKLVYPTYTYRYRMTVEVDVRGETKSGASVIEVSMSKQPQFLPDVPSVATTVRGEAVFVDLGEGRNVIALLASGPDGAFVDYPYYVVPRLFKLSAEDRDLPKFSQLQGRRELEGQLPTLVSFADISDPKTVRVLRPEDFQAVFGEGVRFKGISIEMTSDPITRGIEQGLPWLTRMKARGLGSRIEHRPGIITVNVPYFTRD